MFHTCDGNRIVHSRFGLNEKFVLTFSTKASGTAASPAAPMTTTTKATSLGVDENVTTKVKKKTSGLRWYSNNEV